MDAQVDDTFGQQESGGSSPLDLNRLVAAFKRRLRLMIGVAAAVFLLVVLATAQMTPKYTATAEVLLDPRKEAVADMQSVVSQLPASSQAVDTEAQVIQSRSVAEKVVAKLKLDQDPEFNPEVGVKPGLLDGLKTFAKSLAPKASVDANNSEIAQRKHEKVVDSVIKGLSVKRVGLTYLIDVSFTSKDPAKSAQIANAFADQYLLSQLDAKFDATQQANQWLNGRLADLRVQVEQAETAVGQYKIANNLMSAQGATLVEQEISNLDQQLATTRAEQAEADARLNTAKRQLAQGSTGEDVGEALTSPVVQQLRRQRAEVTQKVADLQGRYGDRHPEMLKAQRQLADIDTQIKQEIGRIISNLSAQAEVARQRTASVQSSVGQSRGNLASNNRDSVRLNELQRNADSVRLLYESLLNRFKETSAQQGLEQSDARVTSRARIPTKQSSPKVLINFAAGVILALGAGIAAAVLAELLSSGLGTAEEVQDRLGLPALGSIPALHTTIERDQGSKTKAVDYVIEKPLSSFTEAFRNLRASVLFSKVGQAVRVILITSSLPGEGKTTTSICLARTMASMGSRVVLLDCDLRQRSVNRMLGFEAEVGLLEVLNGTATLAQALVHDQLSGAVVLPLAKGAYTPKDVFGSAAMQNLIKTLRAEFDIVLIDSAPVLPIADTRVLAALADVVVVLARWRKTPLKALESTLRLLSPSAYVSGVALTQVDMKAQARYGYGDPGYYYRSYQKYYGG